MKVIFLIISVLLICNSQLTDTDIFLNELQVPGYIEIKNGEKIFYWLFKARDLNQNAPLIITLPGGPGCSGMEYALEQNGPFRIDISTNKSLKSNPYSYNNIADVLFVDQPLGTGFSYAFNLNDIPDNIEKAAEDFLNFFQGFSSRYPDYQGRDIYLLGQAFGGHWAIIYTDYLLSHMTTKYNIKGVLITNPMLAPTYQILSYAPFMFHKKRINFVQYLQSYLASILTLVFHYFRKADIALMFNEMIYPIQAGYKTKTFSLYDITKPCTIPGCVDYNPLYSFINQINVRRALGVSETYNWTFCNSTVKNVLKSTYLQDITGPLQRMLDKFNISLFMFNGNHDWLVNTDGLLNFLDILKWSGQLEFRKAQFKDYHSDGKIVGLFKKAKNLFLVTLNESGHFVFQDQPEFAFDFVTRLIYS